jgi:hypothetical protein
MMMMDAKADLVALSRAWRMAVAGVRVGLTGPDFFGQSWHLAEVVWLDAAGSQRITEGRHGHSAEHAIECALGQAWLESQGLWPRKASDDDDDDEDEGCACDDCASCGGSGGGDPPMVCRSCGGSGRSRSEPSEPDYYGDEDDDGEGRGSDWSAWRAREW